MDEQMIRDAWHRNPSFKINVSTRLRKAILLNNDATVMFEGHLYNIKFKSLGGGVWEAYTERRIYSTKSNA